MTWLRHRTPRPSPEALAAVAAADRAHKRAVDQLHGVVALDPEVRAQEALLQAHNASNHWQSWLFSVVLASAQRPA